MVYAESALFFTLIGNNSFVESVLRIDAIAINNIEHKSCLILLNLLKFDVLFIAFPHHFFTI